MRKGWIALSLCAGAAAGLAWGTAEPAQAAMVISAGKVNMSLVEPAARKKRSRAQCTDYLLWRCCKEPGKPEYCKLKVE
ncbi:MAG: hypothetical protein F9K29_06280 [Hyphomicrobiaceae bacterium]|nr:MAG: hypothetical protein F9K29_06280 [Hyphomicrobiaceae bacterium]